MQFVPCSQGRHVIVRQQGVAPLYIMYYTIYTQFCYVLLCCVISSVPDRFWWSVKLMFFQGRFVLRPSFDHSSTGGVILKDMGNNERYQSITKNKASVNLVHDILCIVQVGLTLERAFQFPGVIIFHDNHHTYFLYNNIKALWSNEFGSSMQCESLPHPI